MCFGRLHGGRGHGGKVREIERHARLVTSSGYRCHECPDRVRDERGCPLPRWEEGAEPSPDAVPSCPVLEIPGWFGQLRSRLNRRKSGLVSRDLYADEVILMEALDSALARGERLERERQTKQAEIRRKAEEAAKLYRR